MRLGGVLRPALLAAAVALGPAALPPRVHAEEAPASAPLPRPDVFPLSAVRPGMKGYGLTVKSATRIERFEVEVVDVMKNFFAKQDVILIRCLGEEFADHRIAQGMSGSPIYLEDKVAGALAYAWSWARHALAGVTPIEAMLAEGNRPAEGRPTGAEPPTRIRRAGAGRADTAAAVQDGRGMVPIATPLCVGGFSPASREAIARELDPLGLVVQAGGGDAAGMPGPWANLDAPMAPGSTLMVDLLRGDLSAAALGTCTYVDGNKVYGFGHPFDELGETLLPMSVGYVYTIVSSNQISFKMGNSIREVGAIRQDRMPGIVGVLGDRAPMIPFDVSFRNAVTKREERFRFEVTANRIYQQSMMLMALREAFARAEATLGQNTKRYSMTVRLKGIEAPWTYEDVVAGFDGGISRVLIGLVDRVMIHPTQRAEFERVDLAVEVEHVDRRATIESARPSREQAAPGDPVDVTVRLRTKEGGEAREAVLRVVVPRDAAAGTFAFQVTGGDNVPADVPAPVNISDLPSLTAGFLRSTEVVALVPTGRVDVDMDGRLVRNLPLSALPRLVRSHEGGGVGVRPVTEKVRLDVPYVVEGSVKVSIQVRR